MLLCGRSVLLHRGMRGGNPLYPASIYLDRLILTQNFTNCKVIWTALFWGRPFCCSEGGLQDNLESGWPATDGAEVRVVIRSKAGNNVGTRRRNPPGLLAL